MSVWDSAASQSGVVTVYSIHAPSGLGVHEPARFISCTSMNVNGRSCAASGVSSGSTRAATGRTRATDRERI